MMTKSQAWWTAVLREAAGTSARMTPDPGDFRDELGHRRDVHGPFLTWRRRGISSQSLTPGSGVAPAEGADVLLWRALSDPTQPVETVLEACARADRIEADRGALIPQGLHKTIEVWTETELAALHALSRLGMVRGRRDWLDAAFEAARWHVENLQPDNATNRPWAIHLFAMLDVAGSAEAGYFAQTLLHNCHVTLGRPDTLSAQILVDAAEAIEEGGRA